MAYPPVGIARPNLNSAAAEIIIEVAVPDITAVMVDYSKLQIQSASSAAGSYGDLVTLDLVAGTTFYTTEQTGTVATWLRYRFENNAGNSTTDWSPVFTCAPTGQTFQTIRQELAKEMGMYGSGTTTAAGSTSTVVDSSQIVSILTTNAWQGGWLKMTSGDASGQVSRIASYAIASGTFTVSPVFSAASGSGKTYELYRDLGPTDLDEAINDALRHVMVEDEFLLAGDTATAAVGRKEYPLPYWVKKKAQVRGLDRMRAPGTDDENERLNATWVPVLEGTYELRDNTQALSVVFDHGIAANSVYRVRLIRPYTTDFALRVTSDSTVVNVPLHDIIVAAKYQAYDRLVQAAPPNAKRQEWETRRNRAKAAWHDLLARYYPRSSRLVEPGKQVSVVW
jgi:hypothetical protein